MSQQTINIGTAPNDDTGDPLRTAGDKINDNFTELYAASAASIPGGADTYVQYNDGGAFGGDAGFTYNETTNIVTLTGGLALGAGASISWNSAAAEIVEDSGAILFKDGGTENLRITNAGRVLVNYPTLLTTSGLVPRLQLALNSPGADNGLTWAVYGADIGGAVQFALKTRGANPGAHTIVQDEDDLFELQCRGSDGVGYIRAAAMLVTVDGVPGVNDMPGRIAFHTSPNGGSGALERLRINSAGNINIGGGNEVIQAWPTLFGSQMRFNILGDTFETAAAIVARYSANALGPSYFMAKSRHATIGSHTAVQDNDVIGSIQSYGSDGTEFIFGASITTRVNGTVSTGVVPSEIEVISTSASGSGVIVAKFSADGDFASILSLGVPSTGTGALAFSHASSAFLTTIKAGVAAAAVTYTWPTNVGAAGSALFDAAGNGTLSWRALIGKHTVGAAAGTLFPATTNGCAALAQAETATNKINYKYLAFDAAAVEFAWFAIPTPKSYNASTVLMRAVWTHPATVTNFGVVWQFEIFAAANDDALDTAVGTAVTVTDTGGTTGDFYQADVSAAITPSNTPAKQDWLFVRVSRLATNGSDTMAVDAHLIGVEVYYTTDAVTDD